MIITKSPCRITLGGGGTDLPSFFSKYGAFFITATIDKEVCVVSNEQYYNSYRLFYSKYEEEKNVDDLKHPLFREAIKLLDVDPGIELHSISDIPSGTGLGSSGAFLTSLLANLHTIKGETFTQRQIAEEACNIEIDILKEHEGYQDKYACAFGGLNAFTIRKDGSVITLPIPNKDIIIPKLNDRLMMFSTKSKRGGTASDSLSSIDNQLKDNSNKDLDNYMLTVKDMGARSYGALSNDNLNAFGKIMDDYWHLKQKVYGKTHPKIEKAYKLGKRCGATGGKVMGASSNSGFLMFYHNGSKDEKENLIRTLENEGFMYKDFNITEGGVEIEYQ